MAQGHCRRARKIRVQPRMRGMENLEARVMMDGTLAFPGAVGYGADATGGRGGSIVHVTNLNDSGAGSFRDAVSHSNRIVVFDVGGYVNLQSAVSVSSNITILGQTAPGDGIGFMGREVSFSNKSNDIVQYVRFREGDIDPSEKNSIAFSNSTQSMIFDHVSIEFAQYNNIDAVNSSGVVGNFTVSNSIIGAPIPAQQFNAHTEGLDTHFTWYGNVFIDGHNRNPMAKTFDQFVNNVVYNYQGGYTVSDTSGKFSHDLVNNYFVAGPNTGTVSNAIYQMNSNQKIYARGNMLDGNKDGSLNGRLMTDSDFDGATMYTTPRLTGPTALPTTTAADAYAYDMAHAGASLHRDNVDAYLINEVQSLGTDGQMWHHQWNDGLENDGFGTINGGTLPTDSDHDGIPDYWESANGLNPNNASDAGRIDASTGYAYVEEYASFLANGGSPSSVPEPASIGLLAFGAAVLLQRDEGRRKRRRGREEVGC